MTGFPLPPNATIGLVGGGQLGCPVVGWPVAGLAAGVFR